MCQIHDALFFIICSLIHYTNQSLAMVVVYGEMSESSNCLKYDVEWNLCVSMCARNDSCQIAYKNQNSCELCDSWEVENLSTSEDFMETEIGFKIELENATCPLSTFNLTQSLSELEYSDEPDNETTVSSGEKSLKTTKTTTKATTKKTTTTTKKTTKKTTVKTTTKKKTCSSGWTTFSRPKTTWCMKVFASTSNNFNYNSAVSKCSNHNAVISGLETESERVFTRDTAVSLLGSNRDEYVSVFVSGKRKTKCSVENFESISGCNGGNAFDYSDTYMTNRNGYWYYIDEPNGMFSGGQIQNCMTMWITNPKTDDHHGLLEDDFCSSATRKGVVCGKLPS